MAEAGLALVGTEEAELALSLGLGERVEDVVNLSGQKAERASGGGPPPRGQASVRGRRTRPAAPPPPRPRPAGDLGAPAGRNTRRLPTLTLIHTSVTSSYTTCGWTFLGTALAKATRSCSSSVAGMNRAGGRRTSWSRCWGRSRNIAQALRGRQERAAAGLRAQRGEAG